VALHWHSRLRVANKAVALGAVAVAAVDVVVARVGREAALVAKGEASPVEVVSAG
jgi:hypothetical protein